MKKNYYLVKVKNNTCPFCKIELGVCHIGDYCTNINCEGNYIDGTARLTKSQAKKYKNIITAPFDVSVISTTKNEIKLCLSDKLPDKEGYYWYCNFGEHTPVILRVIKDYKTKALWAQDEEFCFEIKEKEKTPKKLNLNKDLEDEEDNYVDKPFKYGDELWCYVPNPFLPTGKQIKPDCY